MARETIYQSVVCKDYQTDAVDVVTQKIKIDKPAKVARKTGRESNAAYGFDGSYLGEAVSVNETIKTYPSIEIAQKRKKTVVFSRRALRYTWPVAPLVTIAGLAEVIPAMSDNSRPWGWAIAAGIGLSHIVAEGALSKLKPEVQYEAIKKYKERAAIAVFSRIPEQRTQTGDTVRKLQRK